jgi:mannose/fructose/N-acetylgalactosamine-specific phosphotransferase system component IIC
VILELKDLIVASLFGGFINLDTRVLFQMMVSRPVVTAPLVGLVIGGGEGLVAGLKIGAVLELIWIKTLPIGASIPANASLASTLGVTTALFTEGERDVVWIVALGLSLLFSSIFSFVDLKNRELNNGLVRVISSSIKGGRFWVLEGMNLVAILTTFAFGSLSLFLSIIVSVWFCSVCVGVMPVYMKAGVLIANPLVYLLAFGAAVEGLLNSKRLIPYFVAAFVAGGAAVLVR